MITLEYKECRSIASQWHSHTRCTGCVHAPCQENTLQFRYAVWWWFMHKIYWHVCQVIAARVVQINPAHNLRISFTAAHDQVTATSTVTGPRPRSVKSWQVPRGTCLSHNGHFVNCVWYHYHVHALQDRLKTSCHCSLSEAEVGK